MNIKGFHHIAIIASDLEQSLAFYCGALGFDVLDRNFRAERQSWKVDLVHASGPRIELFTFPGAPARPTRPEAQGLRHLAFAVPDIDVAVLALNKAGVGCEPIRIDPYTHQRFTFFNDPDGLPLELYEQAD